MMRRFINNIISVIFTFIKFLFIKLFMGENFKYSVVERFSPDVVTEFSRISRVVLGKCIRVHSGSKIKVRTGGKLIIGDNVKINYNCFIICHDEIFIGDGTEFGPNVFLYDHDHDYKKGLNIDSKTEYFKKAPIVIGKNCWIGANSVLLRGTVLGDNCVVGAGSVINGQYSANELIIQKRTTITKKIVYNN